MRAQGVGRVLVVAGLMGLVVATASCAARSSGTGGSGTGKAAAGSPSGPQTPKFADDFGRTCADGIGFAGSPAYTPTAGAVHPAVLLGKYKDRWSEQSASAEDFPSDWVLTYGNDMAKAELVVCYERTDATPVGKTCKMEDNKTHQPLTVTLYNTQYRLRVLEAHTGKALYDKLADAKSTDCPYLAYTSKDDDPTKYYTEAHPRDYRGAIKPFIAP